MFTIPAPYAPTASNRNAIRLADLRQRAASARNNLQLAAAQLDSLTELLAIADFSEASEVTLGRTYTFSEIVGRNLAEVARLQARYTELTLEIMVLASSMEVTK